MSIQAVKSIFQNTNFGLLIIRASIGVMMFIYGLRKFMGGEEVLKGVGSAVKHMGIDTGGSPALALFFGIVAAGIELVGGFLLVVGFMHRIASFFLAATMSVATLLLLSVPEPDITLYGFPLTLLLIFIGLIWTGPGSLSLQKD